MMVLLVITKIVTKITEIVTKIVTKVIKAVTIQNFMEIIFLQIKRINTVFCQTALFCHIKYKNPIFLIISLLLMRS